MKEYWFGIRIADIKSIEAGGGSWHENENKTRTYFYIRMKDGKEHTINFLTEGYDYNTGKEFEREIKKLFNEHNHIPETYVLENDIFANINGQSVIVGCRCINNLNDYVRLSNLEIDKLRKEFKIKDEGWRHLAYIQAFKIKDNVINSPIEEKWIEQLKSMGYDIDKLKYTLA